MGFNDYYRVVVHKSQTATWFHESSQNGHFKMALNALLRQLVDASNIRQIFQYRSNPLHSANG